MLLNLDFHQLNGILPITKSRIESIEKNSKVDNKESTVIFTNPHPEEFDYYERIGVTEFQAINLVVNVFTLQEEGSILKGLPYSVSLVPIEKNKKIEPFDINLLRKVDLEKFSLTGFIYTDFNPFSGWYDGFATNYSVFSKMNLPVYTDCIGFVWETYFLSPKYDSREVQILKNHTYSDQINAKYRKFKTNLFFKPFQDVNPRRIWGCESPIELFVLQGLHSLGKNPQLQVCIYKDGTCIENYFKMQESEIWIGQDKLITAADFYFQNEKVAIFCDGVEYHDKIKDNAIDRQLLQMGIKPFRFSGKEITENLEKVLETILDQLEVSK